MKLLVNIAHHYEPSRQANLIKVIRAIESYGVDATIYIDTNHPQLSFDLQDERVSVVWHKRMSHPFDLTAKHRIRIDESYQHFDAVAYFEDDMMLPAAGFEYWRTNFDAMHADGFYPSFVRVENYDGVEGDFTPDIVYPLNAEMEVKYDSRRFVALPYHINYHAFWIMTSKAIAALFCLGSLLQASPQVNLAQTAPVTNPSTPNTIPTLALSTAIRSSFSLDELRKRML